MPRVVSLLTLIVAFTAPITVRGRYMVSPLTLISGEQVEGWTYANLAPIPLLLLACVLPRAHVRSGLQAAGSLWILGLVAWIGRMPPDATLRISYLLPAGGWAATCLLECGFVPPRSPPDPWRRPTVALWLSLAVLELYILYHWHRSIPDQDRLWFLSRDVGLASTYLLLAWGRWKSQTWSDWVGALLAGALAAHTLWQADLADRLKDGGWSLLMFLHRQFPKMLIHATLAVLLALRAWSSARAARQHHEATKTG